MAYNNNNYNNGGGYNGGYGGYNGGNRGYSNNGGGYNNYGGGRGYNNYGGNRGNRSFNPGRKHSGCRLTVAKSTGEQVLVGWNYSRGRGMISFIAASYSGTKTTTSGTGREWENWFVKITNKRTMQTTNHSGLWDLQRRRLLIKELNMVANPGAPNGGYFGSHIVKRR